MTPGQLSTVHQSRNPMNADGYQRFDAEFAGGWLRLEVGYRIVSEGCRPEERMTPDGLERDPGEAPTVRLVSLELIGHADNRILPLSVLTGVQRTDLETEISKTLEGIWYE
jgi:hypothetical protein